MCIKITVNNIKFLSQQARDAGLYECQVSTEPKVSARVHLHVVGMNKKKTFFFFSFFLPLIVHVLLIYFSYYTNNSIINHWMEISFQMKYLWVKNYKSTGCNSHLYFICFWHNASWERAISVLHVSNFSVYLSLSISHSPSHWTDWWSRSICESW